jgi:hypothetical protein
VYAERGHQDVVKIARNGIDQARRAAIASCSSTPPAGCRSTTT